MVCGRCPVPGVLRGFHRMGLLGRDSASPGVSPSAVPAAGSGCHLGAAGPTPAGHRVLPNTRHNTLQQLPGGISG